jgi:hypothetical protein
MAEILVEFQLQHLNDAMLRLCFSAHRIPKSTIGQATSLATMYPCIIPALALLLLTQQ